MEQNQMNNDEIEIESEGDFLCTAESPGNHYPVRACPGSGGNRRNEVFITPQYQSVTKMYVLAKQNNDTLTSADMQTSTLLTKRLCRDDSEPYRYGSGYCTAGSGYDT